MWDGKLHFYMLTLFLPKSPSLSCIFNFIFNPAFSILYNWADDQIHTFYSIYGNFAVRYLYLHV